MIEDHTQTETVQCVVPLWSITLSVRLSVICTAFTKYALILWIATSLELHFEALLGRLFHVQAQKKRDEIFESEVKFKHRLQFVKTFFSRKRLQWSQNQDFSSVTFNLQLFLTSYPQILPVFHRSRFTFVFEFSLSCLQSVDTTMRRFVFVWSSTQKSPQCSGTPKPGIRWIWK